MSEEPNTIVKAIGEALAKECEDIFGSAWSNDVRWRFAQAALRSLEDQGISEYQIRGLIDGTLSACDGYCQED